MYTTREAALEDAPVVALLGRQFFDAARLPLMLGDYSADAVMSLVERTTQSEDLVTVVAEEGGQIVGFAAGVVYPSIFNPSVLVGQELFWWVEPEHRRGGVGARLMAALESWAKARGAKAFTMLSMHDLDGEAVGALYQRAGYRPLERTYWKVI